MDDELAFHLEMRTKQLIAAGLSPEEARREALRQFGNIDGVRESCLTMDQERVRAMKRANLFDELRQDLAYAMRVLRRNLGVTTVVTLSLALGIGANTAIFTIVNALLLRRLPVRDPEQLVAIGDPTRTSSVSHDSNPRADLFRYDIYTELRDNNKLVTGLLASGRADRVDVKVESTGAEVERPRGRFVSGNYFTVLGVPALRGRTFDESEDRTIGGASVVTISHRYWTRRFDRDPRAIGRDILINGVRVTIVGVTPEWFTGEIVGQPMDIWIPLTMQPVLMPNRAYLTQEDASWLLLLGRLAPGVTLDQARAGFTPLIRQIVLSRVGGAASEQSLRDLPVPVSSGAKGFSRVRSTYQTPLLTLLVGVGLLLLIICANVANLLLARAVAREREMGVRLAIGASQSRLIRQLLTESLVLATIGAVSGLLVAWWGSRFLLALATGATTTTMPVDVALDLPVLAFTAGVSIVAIGLFGLVPALRASRVDLVSAIRANAQSVTGGSGGRGGRIPIGRLLISVQVALSLVLLIGAALLVRSLRSLQGVETGLDRDHLLIVEVDAASRGYMGARLFSFVRDLSDRLQRVPGVAAVSYSENGIFSGTESASTFQIPGFTARVEEDTVARYDQVGPGYVRAIGARLVQGRDIEPTDDERGTPVALVNQTMARFYFGDTSPIGRTIRLTDTSSVQIVGVIADVRDHEMTEPPVRRFYLSFFQRALGDPGTVRFELRTTGDPAALMTPVRKAIRAFDPQLPIDDVDPLRELMRASIREARLLTQLATGFGVLALLLAAVGLYGVMTYAITRRTSEIGLRVALGAQRGDVLAMVLADALRLVMLGVVVGVPLALASTRLLQNQLHGIEPTDPASIAVALGVLAGSALVAVLLPAMRAARVAPLVALRQD